MLKITIPAIESFDEASSRFIKTVPEIVLEMEHSLVSLSKWESIWEKPFISQDEKTTEEVISYVECMTLTPDVPSEVFLRLTSENYKQINEYIEAKMTATWFKEVPGSNSRANREVITSELFYYWMFENKIPKECENWHLRKLITQIEVAAKKNAPPKKMSKAEMLAERNRINAERQKMYNTTG